MWQIVASRLRSSSDSPGEDVNLATSTILTANSWGNTVRLFVSSQTPSVPTHLVCVSVNTSPDHAEGAFTNDLMDLVNVIEEDFLLIGHFFRRLKPGRQLGSCSLSGLPESCDTVCAVTQICAFELHPTDFEPSISSSPPEPLTSWRASQTF